MTKWKTLAFVALICVFAPSAYGQVLGTPLATQNFDTFLPAGWDVTDWTGVTGNNWYSNDNFEIAPGVPMPNNTGGSGRCAAAADIDLGNNLAWDATLWTPYLDLRNYSTATLSFRHAFVKGTDGRGRVKVYWDGSYYGPLASYVADASGYVTLSLNSYTGLNNVRVVFEFDSDANDDSYWQIDDVGVTGVIVTGIDLQANWGLFRYDGRLFTRVDVTNLGWNPSGTFSVRLQVFDNTLNLLLYDTTRTFTQNARGRALLPGRTKRAKFWVTNRNDLRNGWALASVVRAAGPDDYDGAFPDPSSNNWLLREIR